MQKKIIIANWKSNPDAPGRAAALVEKIERAAKKIRRTMVVIAPPFPFLIPVGKNLKKIKLGAQDMFWEDVGPYTGAVSWHQLKHCGVSYVIIGHSERRKLQGETDDMVNKKVLAALKNGLRPILCVEEHENKSAAPSTLERELTTVLQGVEKKWLKNLIVAYEPLWAISTNPNAHPDTPEDASRARIHIRRIIASRFGSRAAGEVTIIYGGSVNAKNLRGFLEAGNMQGALVGKASLDPAEFARIIEECEKIS